MIGNEVHSLVKDLETQWVAALNVSPYLALDFSWPSVSVLDRITFPLRQKKELGESEKHLIKGAAAYLGVMAHACWEELGATPVVHDEEDHGITIRAQVGPKLLEGDEVVVFIEHELKVILEDVPSPMPVIENFTRVISSVDNFLTSFAIGLFTGLSPALEGPWDQESLETFDEQIQKVVRYLARTTADSYARIHPEEPLGQVAELYLRNLIYPVTLMKEGLPVRLAVRGLMEFFEEYKVPPKKMLEVSLNLARMADDRIAATGFAFHVGLVELEKVGPEISAIAHLHSTYTGLLRRAMLDVREHYTKSEDWLTVQDRDFTEEEAKQIEKEIQLGFLPWVKIGLTKLQTISNDAKLRLLVTMLSAYDWKQSVSLADEIIDEDPSNIDVRVERAYLDILNSDIDSAEEKLKRILTEPEAENEPRVLHLLGSLALVKDNFQVAETYLTKSVQAAATDLRLLAETKNTLGWFKILRGDYYGALPEFEDSLRHVRDLIVPMLNKARVLQLLGRTEGANQVINRLFELAPLSRDIFVGFIGERIFSEILSVEAGE